MNEGGVGNIETGASITAETTIAPAIDVAANITSSEIIAPQPEIPTIDSLVDRVSKLKEEDNSPHETIDKEGARLASEIRRGRSENQAKGNTEKPDIEIAYDLAMKINIFRSLETAKTNGGAFNDNRLEQNRLHDIEGLRKAQVDALAEFYKMAAERGEDFHETTRSMINDIGEVGTRVNLFRVKEKVKSELNDSPPAQPLTETVSPTGDNTRNQERIEPPPTNEQAQEQETTTTETTAEPEEADQQTTPEQQPEATEQNTELNNPITEMQKQINELSQQNRILSDALLELINEKPYKSDKYLELSAMLAKIIQQEVSSDLAKDKIEEDRRNNVGR